MAENKAQLLEVRLRAAGPSGQRGDAFDPVLCSSSQRQWEVCPFRGLLALFMSPLKLPGSSSLRLSSHDY